MKECYEHLRAADSSVGGEQDSGSDCDLSALIDDIRRAS